MMLFLIITSMNIFRKILRLKDILPSINYLLKMFENLKLQY